jgi:hypothetical protein
MVFSAFIVISVMPPLAANFVISIYEFVNSKHVKKIYKYFFFVPLFAIDVFYFFSINNFKVSECNVFYAIYYYPLGFLFGVFYYLPIAISMLILFSAFNETTKFKKELNVLKVGFALTFLPAWILELISHQVLIGIVSILCKFAVILAFSLTYFMLKFRMKEKEILKENI